MIRIIDPSTEQQIDEMADGGAAAVEHAVANARTSFAAGVWRDKTASERARILWNIGEKIEARAEELAAIDARNVGASLFHARNLVYASAEMFRYFAGWTTKIYGRASDIKMAGGVTGGTAELHGYTLQEPVGVVGLIVPWNGPTFNACAKLAPALAAGCSAVLKPSEETPLSARVIGEILLAAGVPEGVVNIVYGLGHTTGAALAAHPDVDKIAFTGSTEVGKLIVQAATGNLKKVMLELGGKSPVLIYDDADLTKAIPGAAMGIFLNSGQVCVCGSRIYAHRRIYDQLVDGLAAAGRNLRLGGPQDEGSDIGPLISDKQLRRVLGYIDIGKSEGGEIVSGGRRLDRKGYFVEPTIITNLGSDSRLVREEIFGPVGTVIPFDDEEQAIAAANDSIYGLAAALWTQDVSRAHRNAMRIEAGTVWLNAQSAWDLSMPVGGYKQSGWGYEYGPEGIYAFLKSKSVYTGI